MYSLLQMNVRVKRCLFLCCMLFQQTDGAGATILPETPTQNEYQYATPIITGTRFYQWLTQLYFKQTESSTIGSFFLMSLVGGPSQYGWILQQSR